MLGHVGEQQLAEHLGGEARGPGQRAVQQQPLRGGTGQHRAAVQRDADQLELLTLEQAQPRGVPGACERAGGREGCRTDVGPAGCAYERDARLPQRPLALHRPLLLADEHGHAGDDEQEQTDRCEDEDDHVDAGIAAADDDLQRRRHQRGDGEDGEPCPRELHLLLGHRLFERAHRGMQGRSAPQKVVRHPAQVEQHLTVVGAVVQHDPVHEVGCKHRCDAPEQQVERRRPLARVHRKEQGECEQQDVRHRVGDRHDLLDRGLGVVLDDRRDQLQPGDQPEADREDQRVDQRRHLARAVAAPGEHDDAGEQQRVEGEVDGVAWRRERHLAAEHAWVDVRVGVAQREHELADGEEVPGPPGLRLVQVGAKQDRRRAREPDRRHDEPVALDRRHPRVQGEQHARHDGGVDGPQRQLAEPIGHAARSAPASVGCSRPRAARSSSARIRRSTSASVFAAVICTRKPTSSRGTSG